MKEMLPPAKWNGLVNAKITAKQIPSSHPWNLLGTQRGSYEGFTPLHIACRSGYSYAATALLKYIKAKVAFPSKVSADSVDAFIHAKNRDGRTAKDLAVFNRLQDAEIALSDLERTLVRMRTGKRREVEKGWSTMIDPNPPNKHSFSLG